MLLNLAIKDVTNFTYVLDVIGEGISSMQSIPMVCCFEAVSKKVPVNFYVARNFAQQPHERWKCFLQGGNQPIADLTTISSSSYAKDYYAELESDH